MFFKFSLRFSLSPPGYLSIEKINNRMRFISPSSHAGSGIREKTYATDGEPVAPPTAGLLVKNRFK
jgi:hypothetical protein